MRGWYREPYRHYLAAKGVRTRVEWRHKYPDLVRSFPGDNPDITRNFARFRQRSPSEFVPGSFRTKRVAPGKSVILGKSKATGKYEVQSVIIRKEYFAEKDSMTKRWWLSVSGPKNDVEQTLGLKRYHLALVHPQHRFEVIDPGDYVKLGFIDGRMQQVWVRVKVIKRDGSTGEYVGIVAEKPENPGEVGTDQGSHVVFRKENVIDMVDLVGEEDIDRGGWLSTKHGETAGQYAHRNVISTFEGTPDDRIHNFAKGVRSTILHPMTDLDEEWEEYSKVAGKPELLSDDWLERWSQRGAALFGRVATQANVEPIVDVKKDRTFREVMMDVEFGRRT